MNKLINKIKFKIEKKIIKKKKKKKKNIYIYIYIYQRKNKI